MPTDVDGCWLYRVDTGAVCDEPALYTINGVPVCARHALDTEKALEDGTMLYRGRKPERGEVIIASLRAADDAGGGADAD